MKKVITITGTHCQACKALIEDIAKEIPGVVSCNVDFQTGKTEVEYDQHMEWKKFKSEIESLGTYQVGGI